MIGAEPERPYERPPLSKDYLRGESEREKIFVHGSAFYEDQRIELRTGTIVEAIDPGASEVALAGGERVRYDRLLIATGAEPRRLEVPGGELEGVHYLRTVADADSLRERLDRGGSVAVIGAGWIGTEVAASARQRGCGVSLIAPGSVPLERLLGAEVGAVYAEVHREHDVKLLLGARVEAFEGEGSLSAVRLSDGSTVACDFAVVGVGVAPRTGLAEAAGISGQRHPRRRAS